MMDHVADVPEIPFDKKPFNINLGTRNVNANDDFRAKFVFPYNYVAAQIIAKYNHTSFFSLELSEITPSVLKKHFRPSTYLCVSDSPNNSRFLCKFNEGFLAFQYNVLGKSLTIEGYYHSIKEVEAVKKQLYKIFPQKKKTIVSTVPIEFWHNTGGEGHRTLKRIENTPKWNDIADNYESGVKEYLTKLMALKNVNGSEGRLILWRGLPGTGKTYAIRALAREWKEWCNTHYIIDPEAFFSSPAYMLNVLLRINEGDQYDDDGNELAENKVKWNLLILEDAGELIVSDAKAQTGPALAKLLNLADGMLGQGMNLLILITTNEEDNRLDRAVSRNGRCLSSILFKQFDTTEAREWLKKKKYKGPLPAERTISDLYAVLNDTGTKKNQIEKKVGFI